MSKNKTKSNRSNATLYVVLVIVLIAVIVGGVITHGFQDWTEQPRAYVSDKILSSAQLLSSDGKSVSAGYRPLKVGDEMSKIAYFAIDVYGKARSELDSFELFTSGGETVTVFIWERYQCEYSFGIINGTLSDNFPNLNEDNFSQLSSAVWGTFEDYRIDEENPFLELHIGDFDSHEINYGSNVDKLGVLPIYVQIVLTELPPAPTKTGYTFTGWYTDEACTNKYTDDKVYGDITLYAGFQANSYEIKFNANSGSGTMANEAMTYDQAKNLTANTFTKEHYAFQGWATSADGEVVYANNAEVKNLTATDGAVIELFAVWERSEVSVTFVSEGNTVATTWIAIGTKATLPETPVKEGHLFDGWYYEDGTKYETQNISEDITLTAKFSIIRCTVTFIVDGEVYAVYVCDWGTSIAQALNGAGVNTALYKADEHSRNF